MNEATQILEALFTGMSAAFTEGLDGAEPTWRDIATEVPSTTSANNYGWLADVPGIKEWVGERQLADLGKHAYRIENKTWETSIKVKRDDVDDDQIGMYPVAAKNFGQEVALFPDQLSYSLLCDGFTELCFDGQPYFDADHPMGKGTYANVIGDPKTDTGEPWFLIDTTKLLNAIIFQNRRPFVFKNMNPNEEFAWFNNEMAAGTDGRCNVGFGLWQVAVGSKAPLTEENYEKAISQMMGVTKSNGTPANVMPTLLVTGRLNRAAAKKLLETVVKANGETNIYHNDVKLRVTPFVKKATA